jgi:hypothetical protein
MKAREYKRHLENQAYLKESGLDTACPTHVFVKLPNRRTIVVSDMHRPGEPAFQKRQTGVFSTSSMEVLESIDFAKLALRTVFATVTISRLPLEASDLFIGFNREAISPVILILLEFFSNHFGSRLTGLNPAPHSTPECRESSDSLARELINFITAFPGARTTSSGLAAPQYVKLRWDQENVVINLRKRSWGDG